jgi:hypothetical protein
VTSDEAMAPPESRVPRFRRSLLTAAAAAGGALATQALVRPSPVAASDVVLGATNTTASATTIRTNEVAANAKALVGVVTHTDAGPSTAGVMGQSNATNGNGVFGVALAGNSKGVRGRSVSGRGVFGEASGVSGSSYGVFGSAMSPSGLAVYGRNKATTGLAGGVFGVTDSSSGQGTTGVANSPTGATHGIVGYVLSNNGTGVAGYASASSGLTEGVVGQVNSTTGRGVLGYATSSASLGSGVVGLASGSNGYGVAGYAMGNGSDAIGVKGSAPSTGYAGYFNGRVHVVGDFTNPGGSALIDQPDDPANRTLAHGFVEAPERLSVYSGTVTLDARVGHRSGCPATCGRSMPSTAISSPRSAPRHPACTSRASSRPPRSEYPVRRCAGR